MYETISLPLLPNEGKLNCQMATMSLQVVQALNKHLFVTGVAFHHHVCSISFFFTIELSFALVFLLVHPLVHDDTKSVLRVSRFYIRVFFCITKGRAVAKKKADCNS